MSKSNGGRQHSLASFEDEGYLQRPHLSEVKPSTGVKLEANTSRSEAWCVECDNRVTIGEKEYGHRKTCAHSCWERRQ